MTAVHFPPDLWGRVFRRIRRDIRSAVGKTWAQIFGSYASSHCVARSSIASYLGKVDRRFIVGLDSDFPGYLQLVVAQAESSLQHNFDLLGSGPVTVAYGMQCKGIDGVVFPPIECPKIDQSGSWLLCRINYANREKSASIWRSIDPSYSPIDWQIDFKSGYRWRENVWHTDIKFGHVSGVDIKVPWELARMQHLPTLALAACFAQEKLLKMHEPEVYAHEFRNQVLDFIATNPPGFGVNWSCPMDVAIRVTNWLIARDLFSASNAAFSQSFDHEFVQSVISHARHIAANLEWAPRHRGNHYLANVVGLMIVAIYLPSSREVDEWLLFAVNEFFSEIDYQFHSDGSNFEGSVCYHRLSAEMISWGLAFLMNLSNEKANRLTSVDLQKSLKMGRGKMTAVRLYSRLDRKGKWPIPLEFWARFKRFGDFTEALTKPDGLVVQFGDNDSGRFIPLGSGEQLLAANDPSSPIWSLDHSSLVAGINALIGAPASSLSKVQDAAAKIRLVIAGDAAISQKPSVASEVPLLHEITTGTPKDWSDICALYENASDNCHWLKTFEYKSLDLLHGLQLTAFTGMGCYIFRGTHLYLAVRCGEIGLAGLGGHAHCDQLAIELTINGENLVSDPGTYVYTPFPDKRNAYRSAFAHHVPRVRGKEPADLTKGIFDLSSSVSGECLYFGLNGFIGRHRGYGSWIYRLVEIKKHEIVVKDFSNGDLLIDDPLPRDLKYSQSYGRQLPN